MTDRIEPSRSTVTFTARGHADIRASHDKTIEFVEGPHITARATCVVGVSAGLPLHDLQAFRGPIVVDIEAGGMSERVMALANPHYSAADRAVVRRSDHRSTETLATGADKGAADLDRDLVRLLADPATEMRVTVSAADVAPIAAAELLVLPALVDPDGDSELASLLRGVALVVDDGEPLGERALPDVPTVGGEDAVDEAWRALERGGVVALLADPTTSRTAAALLRLAANAGVPIRPVGVPDPRAVALLATGIPLVRCILLDAPAVNRASREREAASVARLRAAAAWEGTGESVVALAAEMAQRWADVPAALLLAPHGPDERHVAGTLAQLEGQVARHERSRDRAVLVVDFRTDIDSGQRLADTDDADDPVVLTLVDALLSDGVSARTLAGALAGLPGVGRRRAYELVHARKKATGTDPDPS